jgi:hypothetical protein
MVRAAERAGGQNHEAYENMMSKQFKLMGSEGILWMIATIMYGMS